jgi:DNA invertase Pin-like site-specific DNA recombinase
MKRLERDDLLIVTRLDRLARSTRDLLNILRTAISRSLTRSLRRTIQAG